jgi:hypothetical protein
MDLIPIVTEDRNADAPLARSIVDDGLRRYFAQRHAMVDGFVTRHFSLAGSLRLHRAAVGFDIARAPLNLAMAGPQLGLVVASKVAGGLGARRVAAGLASKRLTVATAVSREINWRLQTELLELPFRDGNRVARRDALAETILSDPRVAGAIMPTLEALDARGDEPALRARLETMLAEYGRTRGATNEIAATLAALANSALALRTLAPGALSLGQTLAGTVARRAAVSLPFGGALTSAWAGLLPATRTAGLVAGMTSGLLAGVAAAFAGVVTDPVQRRLGLHQRRLHRMLDALERQMKDPAAEGFVLQDHYVTRLIALLDVAAAVLRLMAR